MKNQSISHLISKERTNGGVESNQVVLPVPHLKKNHKHISSKRKDSTLSRPRPHPSVCVCVRGGFFLSPPHARVYGRGLTRLSLRPLHLPSLECRRSFPSFDFSSFAAAAAASPALSRACILLPPLRAVLPAVPRGLHPPAVVLFGLFGECCRFLAALASLLPLQSAAAQPPPLFSHSQTGDPEFIHSHSWF